LLAIILNHLFRNILRLAFVVVLSFLEVLLILRWLVSWDRLLEGLLGEAGSLGVQIQVVYLCIDLHVYVSRVSWLRGARVFTLLGVILGSSILRVVFILLLMILGVLVHRFLICLDLIRI
jgi:hypothetical protein